MIGTEGGITTVYIGNYFEWYAAITDTVNYDYSGATLLTIRIGNFQSGGQK
jgi:hypothetical protein